MAENFIDIKLRCIIVDDEPVAREGLAADVREVGFIDIAGMAGNALLALDMIKKEQPDLVFLDIGMPKLSGIDMIKLMAKPPMIIITTAYPEFAIEGYQLDVIDYLLKPIAFARLLKACNKARELFILKHNAKPVTEAPMDYFFIKCDGRLEKIVFDDLLMIEAANNYVIVHTAGKSFLTYQTLKNMEAQLPALRFIKVHKSYIVAVDKIDRVEGNMIVLDKHTIPVSRSYRDVLVKAVASKVVTRR